MSFHNETCVKKRRKCGEHHDHDTSHLVPCHIENTSSTEMMVGLKAMRDKVNTDIYHMKTEMDAFKHRLSNMDKLESKCRNLEGRCDSLERSLRVYLKESKQWEYPIPLTSETHWWQEQGCDHYYAQNMGMFERNLKDKTCELRLEDKSSYHVCVGDYGTEIPLRHDIALMQHWVQLADAIQVRHVTAGSFSISNMQLPPEVLNLLSMALKTKGFDRLSLTRNGFINVYDGINFAIDVINNNPGLNSFGWAENQINTMEDANSLLEAINRHPALKSITFKDFCGRRPFGYEVLCSLLAGNGKVGDIKFSDIDLESNGIRTMGGTHIPDFLALNPPMTALYLDNNHLNDVDALLLADALKLNTNLKHLFLGGNDEITETGREALLDVIYNPMSLNTLWDSNHRCYIGLGDLRIDKVFNNYEEKPSMNRGKKIFLLLCSRNLEGTNAHHFDMEFGEDCLKLVPDVLECVQRYHDIGREALLPATSFDQDNVPATLLSIMYETLRSWKMPMLYEAPEELPLPSGFEEEMVWLF